MNKSKLINFIFKKKYNSFIFFFFSFSISYMLNYLMIQQHKVNKMKNLMKLQIFWFFLVNEFLLINQNKYRTIFVLLVLFKLYKYMLYCFYLPSGHSSHVDLPSTLVYLPDIHKLHDA